MKKPEKEPLLLVTWTDAGTVSHGDWMSREDVLEHARPEQFTNRTVGWLIHEDKTGIVLASQIADGERPEYDLVMRIPKSLIRTRRVL